MEVVLEKGLYPFHEKVNIIMLFNCKFATYNNSSYPRNVWHMHISTYLDLYPFNIIIRM